MKQFKHLFLLLLLTVNASIGFAQTECSGTTNELSQGSGLGDYTYSFTMSGSDVVVDFEVVTPLTGLVAYSWYFNPGVIETPMTNIGGQKFRKTFTGLANGSSLKFAVKFAWAAGGFAVTKQYMYTVGNTCGGNGNPAPTLSGFSIPSKVLGDANFTITPPSSNSTGAFSYTSSNTDVASIFNTNQIHIVGGGTSTITATQAADATHSSGAITATFTVTVPVTTPTAGPATPPARNPWDVLSQYGLAYTNQYGVGFYDFGGSTIVGDLVLADNSVVKKYINHSYSGISTNAAQSLNVSAMTHLHMDVWSPDFVSFKVKLEATNGSNVELEVPGAKSQGTWNSYDIPLSSYSAVDLAHLRYIVPVTFNPNNTTLYITNVYFYRPATTQPPTLGTFTVPSKNVGDADFTLTPPTSNSSGTWSYSSSNTAVATISGSTVHIVGGGTSTITATQAAASPYGTATATATFTVNFPDPGAPPSQPARNPSDVISIFADPYYTNVSGTDFNPNWGQSANHPNNLTTPSYGGNPVKQYQNTGTYQGTNLAGNTNVSVINKLHVDIYSPTLTSIGLSLINQGIAEAAITLPLTPGTWNSFDIDCNATNFPNVNMTQVNQIKYDNFKVGSVVTGNQILAIDNLYFYKDTATPPTLGTFTVAAHVLGDADFAITPPTSNSAGTWSYSSSNTAVATIVGGSNIHIVGAGTSTITATQAANGVYASASTTATFTVTVPPLTTPAPTPPARNAWDVVSVYSNAYTPVASTAWSADATASDEQLSGNDTKKISNFLIENVEFGAQNLTQMTMMHVDVYSEDCTGLNFWLLNNGDRVAQRSVTLNQWNSFDIPLSTYTALGLNLNGVHLLKFESLNGGGKTIWVDNVYFYRPATSLPPTLSNFSIPTQAYNAPDFALTAPTSNSAGAFSYTSSNTAVATISGNVVHIVGPGTTTITATQAAQGSYGTGSITALLTVAYPEPGPSPIPPARPADRVISMFTGNPPVYANAITAVQSAWTAGTTTTEVPNGTNTALRLDNFGFLGLIDQNELHFGATGMSHLHLDVYLNAPLSNLLVYLLANGDYAYMATNLTAGWNSLSIPLTNYAAADLSQVWGLKLEQLSGSPIQAYLDNVYFSNECYTYYSDADGDGYGNAASPSTLCAPPTSGFVLDNTDCDDTLAAVNPGHAEVAYNGVDDNCDGTIDEGSRIYSKVLPTQCGTTLATLSSLIGAVSVGQPVNGYRFEVTNLTTNAVQTIERTVPNFSLTMLVSYDYATTYSIRVMLRRNGMWLNYYGDPCLVSTPAILDPGGAAAVSPSQCGIVLPTLSTLIATTNLPGVTAYRFRVTNLTDSTEPNVQQVIERNYHWFSLTMLTRFNYGTEYQVEVAVKTANGTWSGYGSPCNVSSPNVPTLSNCGATIAANTTYIATTSLNRAQAYRFEVTNMTTFQQTIVDRSLNWFNFTNVPGFAPGTVYSVRVAIQTSGYWSPFGEACSITSPGAARTVVKGDEPTQPMVDFRAVVYPNPYAESFALDMDTDSEATIQVKVYDMMGKLVEDRNFAADAIETQQFGERYPSGVYNLVVSQAGFTKTLRVIKR